MMRIRVFLFRIYKTPASKQDISIGKKRIAAVTKAITATAYHVCNSVIIAFLLV